MSFICLLFGLEGDHDSMAKKTKKYTVVAHEILQTTIYAPSACYTSYVGCNFSFCYFLISFSHKKTQAPGLKFLETHLLHSDWILIALNEFNLMVFKFKILLQFQLDIGILSIMHIYYNITRINRRRHFLIFLNYS